MKRFTSIEEVKTTMSSQKQEIFTPNIAIIGVGGAGANAINNLINMNLAGVKFIVANTDAKSLENSLSPNKIRLGLEITKGLGAGSKPDIGFLAAEESMDEIRQELEDVDLLFLVAGMGGGTGTGASQVIAKIAKDLDILTLGFVTKPFSFEGKQRMNFANEGIFELQKYIDSLVVISNQNLFKVISENTSMVEAFRIMDNVIHSGVKAITDLIISNGMVNLDFNDIKSVIKGGGKAMVTSIEVAGSDRVNKITDAVVNNPLIDKNITLLQAKNILINVTGGINMTLFEVDKIVNSLRDKANKDTYINFGAIFDEKMSESIRVAIVATGIDEEPININAAENNNFYAEAEQEELLHNNKVMQQQHNTEEASNRRNNIQENIVKRSNNEPNKTKIRLEEEYEDEEDRSQSYLRTAARNEGTEYKESAAQASSIKKAATKQPLEDIVEREQRNKPKPVESNSLFNLIEKQPLEDDSDDEQEEEKQYTNIRNINVSKKSLEELSEESSTKNKNPKSFFELPPFLRQKK